MGLITRADCVEADFSVRLRAVRTQWHAWADVFADSALVKYKFNRLTKRIYRPSNSLSIVYIAVRRLFVGNVYIEPIKPVQLGVPKLLSRLSQSFVTEPIGHRTEISAAAAFRQ
jgi:hypothetical protein